MQLLAELMCAEHASGVPWVRFIGKSIHLRNFGYDVTYVCPSTRTDCRGGEAGEPLGTECMSNFCLVGNHIAALHLATRIFLAGNRISNELRDKEQES